MDSRLTGNRPPQCQQCDPESAIAGHVQQRRGKKPLIHIDLGLGRADTAEVRDVELGGRQSRDEEKPPVEEASNAAPCRGNMRGAYRPSFAIKVSEICGE
jgi:hypothetical protein